MDKLRAFETFVAVATRGSLSAAARAEAKKSAADASELRGKVATLEAKSSKGDSK